MNSYTNLVRENYLAITLLITVVLFVFGVFFFIIGARTGGKAAQRRADWSGLGTSLISGACFALAALLVQIGIESTSFLTTVAVSDNLTGFDPHGRSLKNVTLAGKNLERASLGNADLEGANLQEARLTRAILNEANLRHADLFYTVLDGAALIRADLTDARLYGAKFKTNYLDGIILTDAAVHDETCWPVAMNGGVPTAVGRELLRQLGGAGLQPRNGDVIGHVCADRRLLIHDVGADAVVMAS